MKRLLLGIAALVGLFAITGSTAQAQWGHGGSHYGANSYGTTSGYGFANPYSYGGHGGYGNWGFSSPRWHDTTHFDYHPSSFVPHGNHLHVQPGHYDSHRSGHWHH
ncbi:MAG: hypothetical protein WD066_03565 [Planctomycetaceae bacterium]